MNLSQRHRAGHAQPNHRIGDRHQRRPRRALRLAGFGDARGASGTGSTNLQTTSRNPSPVNAFYVDHKRTASGPAIRVGRQTAISGGLLGLFDGVSLAYPVGQGFKIDVMGGKPANNLVSAPGQRLFAAVLEADGLFDRFGGNIYLIDQTVEGNTNRRAVGAEVRYSDEKVSIYSLVDYDTVFKGLNAVSLQGSFLAPAQTSITLLVDGRKAPTLQLTNASDQLGPALDRRAAADHAARPGHRGWHAPPRPRPSRRC